MIPLNYKNFTIRHFLVTFAGLIMTMSVPGSEVLGPIYPIVEPNLLEVLQTHTQESVKDTQSQYRQTQKKIENWLAQPIGRPLPQVQTVKRATKEIKLTIPDLIDNTYRRYWLFIDADLPSNVLLAQKFLQQCTQPVFCRVILVSGSLQSAQKKLQTRLWFDQGGRLTEHLSINALPALTTFSPTRIQTVMAFAEHFPLKESLK